MHNIGVAQQIARYSDAIETASHLRWFHPSGTPGLTETGELPKDITSQAWLAWQHISEMLERANMTPGNLGEGHSVYDEPERRSHLHQSSIRDSG